MGESWVGTGGRDTGWGKMGLREGEEREGERKGG